jgi:hypothetical protein
MPIYFLNKLKFDFKRKKIKKNQENLILMIVISNNINLYI